MDNGRLEETAAKTSFTLPKSLLLRKSGEFGRVYKEGRRIRGNRFAIVYAPNQLPHHRFGISIHGARGSVQRNRMKRIIRECFRLKRELFYSLTPADKGVQYDIVLAVRQGFTAKTPQDVGTLLHQGLG